MDTDNIRWLRSRVPLLPHGRCVAARVYEALEERSGKLIMVKEVQAR